MPSIQDALGVSGSAPIASVAEPGPEDEEALDEALADAKAAWDSNDARALGRALNLLRTLTDDE